MMDEHKIELLLARTERHDKMLEDHGERLIKLETHQGADYEWRKKIDENLGTINSKLEVQNHFSSRIFMHYALYFKPFYYELFRIFHQFSSALKVFSIKLVSLPPGEKRLF